MSVHKVCNPKTFSKNIIIEQFVVDRKMLIEMIEEKSKLVVSKEIESVDQDESYKYALLDNFPASSFCFEEPKTALNSRITFHKYKNVE